jgi:hypothetical protein
MWDDGPHWVIGLWDGPLCITSQHARSLFIFTNIFWQEGQSPQRVPVLNLGVSHILLTGVTDSYGDDDRHM